MELILQLGKMPMTLELDRPTSVFKLNVLFYKRAMEGNDQPRFMRGVREPGAGSLGGAWL